MACDRDLAMVSSSTAPMMGSGILTVGSKALPPGKNPVGKSRGLLPKIPVRLTHYLLCLHAIMFSNGIITV